MSDFKSFAISAFSSSPAFYALIAIPSTLTIVASIVLPCIFFVISQVINILFQLWKVRREEQRNK